MLRVVRGRHPRGHGLARGEGATRSWPRWSATSWGRPRTGGPNPRDDMLTHLAQVDLDGERLSDDELGMFLVQLLVAGNETTRDLISTGLLAFAEHPGQWEQMRARPRPRSRARWRRCCGGRLRWCRSCAPPPGPRSCAAWTSPQASPLLMLFASANRDEEVFGPDAGDLRRRRAIPTPTSPSGRATISAWARRWPASKGGWCSRSSPSVSRRSWRGRRGRAQPRPRS